MEAKHNKKFNHDPWANAYDEDVADESNPIRDGYAAVLDFVAARCPQFPGAKILDIGIGTGNLALRLNPEVKVVGIDISTKMMELARQKLAATHSVTFEVADMLAFLDNSADKYDGIISSYVIHHLTEDEKEELFSKIASRLNPGGRAVFGDLMFATRQAQDQVIKRYQEKGQEKIVVDIQDEFFWFVDQATMILQKLGLTTTAHQLSDLSWVITAEKQT